MCAWGALVIKSRFFWEAVLVTIRFGLIVCRACCNNFRPSDGGTRSCMQGRLEPFGNLAVN